MSYEGFWVGSPSGSRTPVTPSNLNASLVQYISLADLLEGIWTIRYKGRVEYIWDHGRLFRDDGSDRLTMLHLGPDAALYGLRQLGIIDGKAAPGDHTVHGYTFGHDDSQFGYMQFS